MNEILFDFDVVVYRAAFANQKTVYRLVDGEGVTKEEADRINSLNIEPMRYLQVEKVVIPAPLPYALATARNIITCVQKELNIEKYRGYLTDSDSKNNFRVGIEGNLPYKANRKDFVKPLHYEAIREYLLKEHQAILVTGQEADDQMGIDQMERGLDSIIASIDKDLMQIPGYHYNIKRKKIILATDPGILKLKRDNHGLKISGTGFKWFCAQMMLGDKVDNVEGLRGYGPKKVYELLNPFTTIEALWNCVDVQYAKNWKSTQNLFGTAQLLWIRRKSNQVFNEELLGELYNEF